MVSTVTGAPGSSLIAGLGRQHPDTQSAGEAQTTVQRLADVAMK